MQGMSVEELDERIEWRTADEFCKGYVHLFENSV